MEALLGIRFQRPGLLAQALVHSSYVNENPDYSADSNERLEFLGDAVIGLLIADRLFRQFPELPEDRLTRLRAELVRSDSLARAAGRLGLGRFLKLGRGEEVAGARERPLMLARALEAVVGGLWLDRGLGAARERLAAWLEPEWRRIESGEVEADPKTRLQHLAQAHRQRTPVYRIVGAEGPDHARLFTVEARLGDEVVGRGQGRSKQLAEMAAAREALERLGWGAI